MWKWCVVRCVAIGHEDEHPGTHARAVYLREGLVSNGAVEFFCFHVALRLECALLVELVAAQSSAGRRGLEIGVGHAREGELAGRLRERLDRERLHHFLGLDRGVVLPRIVAKTNPDVFALFIERDLGANLRARVEFVQRVAGRVSEAREAEQTRNPKRRGRERSLRTRTPSYAMVAPASADLYFILSALMRRFV